MYTYTIDRGTQKDHTPQICILANGQRQCILQSPAEVGLFLNEVNRIFHSTFDEDITRGNMTATNTAISDYIRCNFITEMEN